jgi:hypothetical protein
MKTLIVSRTCPTDRQRCIGGLAYDDEGTRSVRLINPDSYSDKGFWHESVPFEIGDIWDLNFEDVQVTEPPHVEDALVRKKNFVERIDDTSELVDAIKSKAQKMRPRILWGRGPWNLFSRKLKYSKREDGKGYVVEDDLPQRSTGFYIPNRDLVLEDPESREYTYQRSQHHFGVTRMKYVGEPEPIEVIPKGTLVRVSLARWAQLGHYPNACWLMMSGWYL